MNDHQFDKSKLEASVGDVAAAMTDKAHALNAIPLDCRYECSISIGPDGKPVYTCRVVCGF